MSPILFLSIFLTKVYLSTCIFLEAESNYMRPKLERNNIVNKGVWVRNRTRENLFDKSSLGNFVFRSNSLDADRLLQTNFETFSYNAEASPFVSDFDQRSRRSPRELRKRQSKRNMNGKKRKNSVENYKTNSIVNNPTRNSLSNLPYDVSSILNDSKEIESLINKNVNASKINETIDLLSIVDNINEDNVTLAVNETKENITESTTETSLDTDTPKRSRKHSYGLDSHKSLNLQDEKLGRIENNKANRNVFVKNDVIWHQNAPVPDRNMYEIVPHELETTKGVTERGLIRVISMITKSFKKIMKQHKDMKVINDKLTSMNDGFLKHIRDINIKFQDFDSKYSDMVQFSEKLKAFEDKMTTEEEYLKNKHKEMDNNMLEFENQQKKFLSQQKQFYAVQKVMLAQNEKISKKQSTIAKTQSEISHRQNNFARILKKAKQLTIDKKIVAPKENDYKVTNAVPDTATIPNTKTNNTEATTHQPATSESIKLNLFSIPIKTKLQNQDELIMKEKDKRPIDDLVYKYYFNNTFIDSLMKSKILNNFATHTSIEIARNVKNKRDELETTILLPVNNNNNKNRIRRWIKNLTPKNENTKILKDNSDLKGANKKDPFFTMATSFCSEIGQNQNKQTLNWCIEKALRRLKFMDQKLFPKPVTVMKEKKPQVLQPQVSKDQHTTSKPGVTAAIVPSTVWLTTIESVNTPMYAVTNPLIYFPDNEELESNLKQYDLTPDTEGTVYYDGSLHYSDVGHGGGRDSDGMSDIMPGLLDSNSKVDMNPMAFDIQAKRRAFVSRLNEDIIKKYKNRKL